VKRPAAANLCVITDAQPLGSSLLRLLNAGLGDRIGASAFCYSQFSSLGTMRRIMETDLFVLELFRRNPGGLRAEGVAMAQKLWRWRKPSLIISPLFLADRLKSPSYWDLASHRSMAESAEWLLEAPALEGIDRLTPCFARFLEIPPQHGVFSK
jgi:hypothetical protein